MIYQERPAPESLAGVVTRVWYLQATPLRRFEKILPMPFVHVIVNLSDPYRIFDRRGEGSMVPDTFVSGLQSEYLVIESPQLIRHVGAELTPTGLSALARQAPGLSARRVIDARTVLPGLAALGDRLRRDTAARAPDAVLGHALDVWSALPAGPRDALATAAVAAIEADPERPIGEIARHLGVSHGVLTERMRSATGTTPKRHARVVRFHRLVDAAHAGGGTPDWAALAVEAGYYDQPHVIREFRRFSGWTPAEYLRLAAEHGPDAAHFVPLDRVPAQTG